MPRELNELLEEIRRLEEQLESYWDNLREQFNYTLENRKVLFEKEIRDFHKGLRVGVIRYICNAELRNILSAPFIYMMIIPLVLLDCTFTLYQHLCFRLYRIPSVNRRDYIVIDRHRLGYLNAIEKFNCIYCGYGNGLIAYVKEILARTEQYWCPIKHARRVLSAHDRYVKFKEFGDAQGYRKDHIKLRQDFNE